MHRGRIHLEMLIRMAALTLIALVMLSVVLGQDSARHAAADEGHPNLAVDFTVNWVITGCLSYGPPPVTCDVGVGRTMHVRTVMGNSGGVQFDAVQFAIEYSGLTSKDNADIDFPDCLSRTDPIPQPANKVIFGCNFELGPAGAATGTIDFNCTDTPSSGNVITMLHGTGVEGTHIRDGSGVKHSEASGSESVTINCVEPQTADMTLNAQGPELSCDQPSEPSQCSVEAGSPFTLIVETKNPPAGGIEQFGAEVHYGTLLYSPVPDNPSTSPENEGANVEIVWPNPFITAGVRFPFQPTGTEGMVAFGSCCGQEDYAGHLIELSMACEEPGTVTVTLPAYDPPATLQGASFFNAAVERVYLNSSDSLDINCTAAPAVGGVSLGEELDPLPLESADTPGDSAARIIVVAAFSAVATAGGAAWYARRRWRS